MSKLISLVEARLAGLTRYFTGKPCKSGHIAERSVANRGCIECLNLKFREWCRENPEKAKEKNLRNKANGRNKRRAIANGATRTPMTDPCIKGHIAEIQVATGRCVECIAESRRKWARENPDKIREKFKRWRLGHIEYVRVRNKHTYERDLILNRERAKERMRLARIERPEQLKAQDQKKRAKRALADGSHTGADIQDILRLQRSRCAICRCRLYKGYHVDHIIPLARGGSNYRSNLQILCADCNHTKSAKDPIDFSRSLGRLL